MPTYYSPSVHVEERAGSIVVISRNSSSGSDLLNRQKSERNDEGNFSKVIEDENSFLAACAYHEETVDATKEANRMFEQQSDVSQGSCKTLPSNFVKAAADWPKLDEPIFISPWNNDPVQQQQQQGHQLEVREKDEPTTPTTTSIHPFARRTKSRSFVEQKNLFSTTSTSTDSSSSDDPPKGDPDIWDESFDEILRTANRSIETAESILSTLRRGEENDVITPTKASTHDNQISPVSDIETNIRRLEKAQDEINAALANFRSVQALSGTASATMDHRSIESKGPPPPPPRPTPKVMSIVAKRKEMFESQKRRSGTLKHSQTLPEYQSFSHQQSDEMSPKEPETGVTNVDGKSESGPVKPARRHSFNSCKSATTTTAAESGDSHYEADGESSHSCNNSNRTNANNDNSSYSDSEAGTKAIQVQARIKSLWGSFRKKRPMHDPVIVRGPVRAAPTVHTTNSSLYSCFGGTENGSNPVDSSASSSYHTPGSPAKQQSDSSSSLSSFNPKSNRNSSSSDESSEHGGTGTAKSEGAAPQNLTTPQQRKAFYIARELMSSERVFVDVLKLVNVEFREYIQRARKESKSPIISDADFRRIFNNLTELQALNEHFLQDFEIRIENWSESQKIADVIAKKGPFLKLYNNYIREFSSLCDHFEDCLNRLPKFKKLVMDFESKDRCKHLRIQHYMLKPVQRLPQYRLLLEDYLKHLDPDGEDFDDTTTALRIVSEVAEQADNTIKQGENFRRMMKLQSRLGDSIELIKPGRYLIKEGELLKISRKGVDPRYFILLSDCLLYTAYSGNLTSDLSALKLSYKIPLTSLRVKASNRAEDFQNEFSIQSTVRSCTLRATTVKERNDWLDALHTAIEDHVMRKRTFKDQCKLPAEQPEKARPGEVAPVWVPDRRVTMCQKCAVEFTVLVRRHHCRSCGQVVCSTCSANTAPLKYRSWKPARVCDTCYDAIESDLSKDAKLASRFHKRDPNLVRVERYVPGRLRETGEGAQMCGYLKRKSKGSRSWKRMWYVIKDKVFYVYKAPEDNVAVESFPVLGYELDAGPFDRSSDVYEGENASLVFRLTHPGSEILVFSAETAPAREKWIEALHGAVRLTVDGV